MKKALGYIYILIIISSLFGCSAKYKQTLKVEAQPIDAELINNRIIGASTLNDSSSFVWGSSVIKGEDNRYHMFYSTWEAGKDYPKFSDGWVMHSKIAYAVSDESDKNFKFKKVILEGRKNLGDSRAWDVVSVHNPHIKKFGNKYYLYYTGSKDPGIQSKGSPGEKVNKRNRIQQSQKIGVVIFNSFEDLLSENFERLHSPVLIPRTRIKNENIVNPSPQGTRVKPDNIIVVNPSVVKRNSDGKFLLYFKGNIYDPYWRGVHGVAIGDSPIGPFKALDDFIFNIKMDDGKIASAEDPYVWYHSVHDKYYAVMKDFSGRITGDKPGLAILHSNDGISWEKSKNSKFMNKELMLKSGSIINVNNLERPQLLLDNFGNPLVLYAACSVDAVGNKKDGSTFNVHIKLTQKTN